jgi:hypothetical protein
MRQFERSVNGGLEMVGLSLILVWEIGVADCKVECCCYSGTKSRLYNLVSFDRY